MSLTTQQITNAVGFPKPAELIEITGTSALEAQDRAIMNVLYQHAHDSGHLTKPGAKWEIPAAALRTSRHESNDRLQDALLRLMQVVVHVPYPDPATGDPRVLLTPRGPAWSASAFRRTSPLCWPLRGAGAASRPKPSAP